MSTTTKARFTYARIGSVSEGTLRDDDLISSFAWELEHLVSNAKELDPEFNDKIFAALLAEANEFDAEAEDADDVGPALVADLMDALNEFAPPLCYFGANEGDGACFGFWPSDDAIQDWRRDGGLVVDDLSDVPEDFVGEVMIVNDHGNIEFGHMADGKFIEAWLCV